ncbi:MAG: hypothetical protein MUO88_07905 [Desulfobacterales bacterium]|nr:hypothetical protein [Desulfobacterales bacterium]
MKDHETLEELDEKFHRLRYDYMKKGVPNWETVAYKETYRTEKPNLTQKINDALNRVRKAMDRYISR